MAHEDSQILALKKAQQEWMHNWVMIMIWYLSNDKIQKYSLKSYINQINYCPFTNIRYKWNLNKTIWALIKLTSEWVELNIIEIINIQVTF